MRHAQPAPDSAMLAPIERLARFVATGDGTFLDGVFARADVTIHENFAPFVFTGPDSVARWAPLFRDHAKDLGNLKHSFGPAQDFNRSGTEAYFALPTTWTGLTKRQPFIETGGWSFVLVAEKDEWRIRAYAWAVTSYEKMQ